MKLAVKIILTHHARLKLRIYRTHKVKIITKDIKAVLDNPTVCDESNWPIIKTVGDLDGKHSLVIIYKIQDAKIIIITLWPAEKGRYEGTI